MVVKEHIQNWHRKTTSQHYHDIYLQAKADIAVNCRNGRPKLVNFAESYGLSPRTVQRSMSFHAITWRKLVTQVTMHYASRLLTGTNWSISEIAKEAGYKRVSQFSRAYKRHCGISPEERRRIYRSSLESQ